MSTSGVAQSVGDAASDVDLVAAVRSGDDVAFEELYRRYHRRIRAFAQRRLHDPGRAEDVTQEAFLSALRRLRATDSDIAFKPWLFEIARNAAIDVHRRTSRAEEVPVDDELLPASDRHRLVGGPAPDVEAFTRQRLELLSGAFAELPEVHHRALVMREFEGLSYREIGERLELTRSAVESTIFRARRRLEQEYEELAEGRRCESARNTMALIAEGLDPGVRRRRRFARHTRRCTSCRRRARELGVVPPPALAGLRHRAAGLLPLPLFLRRRAIEAADGAGSGGAFAGPGIQSLGSGLAERAASLLAAAALAGAGGAAIHGSGGMEPPEQLGVPESPAGVQQQSLGAPTTAEPTPFGSASRAGSRARVVPEPRRERARASRAKRDRWSASRKGRRDAGSAPAQPEAGQADQAPAGQQPQEPGGGLPGVGSQGQVVVPDVQVTPGVVQRGVDTIHKGAASTAASTGVEGFVGEAAQQATGAAETAAAGARLALDDFS